MLPFGPPTYTIYESSALGKDYMIKRGAIGNTLRT